jgi:peptidyl-prolyl cis-trans isomerase C
MNSATDTDAELFYRLNPERFLRPERRTVRHILITFNTPEERHKAELQLNELAEKLRSGADFAKLALRHSQCPTALEGGLVGNVPRGQLFPQLDAVLFTLEPGELAPAVETEVGLHLLRCEAILPPDTIPFEMVRERIIAALNKNRHINHGRTVN